MTLNLWLLFGVNSFSLCSLLGIPSSIPTTSDAISFVYYLSLGTVKSLYFIPAALCILVWMPKIPFSLHDI